MHAPQRKWRSKVVVLYGQSGCGKSYGARILASTYGDVYSVDSEWFDGYTNQPAVIVDEFAGWIPFNIFKKMCDSFAMQVKTKGGFANFRAKIIVFTTNKDPLEWYTQHLGERHNYEAFVRRIDEYWVCDSFCYRRVNFPGWNGGPRTVHRDIGEKIAAIEADPSCFDEVMGSNDDVMSKNKTWV